MTRLSPASVSASVPWRSRWLRGALLGLMLVSLGCDKEKPKADETKKAEATPVPSGMVFNDFLPTTGSAAGLGVRDSGVEGGLAGMGGGEPAAGQPGEQPAGEKVAIKVVEPGAEPRAVRKYTFTPNKVDKRVITITQSVSQSAGGQTAPAQEITIKIALDLTPKQVKPTGATFEAKVMKVELPGAPPQAAQMLASLNGLSGTFEVTSNGEVGEVSFAGSPQMKNQLAESILGGVSQATQMLLTPLPTSPVGAGAKWEAGNQTPEGQIVNRFTLKEVSNEGGVVESEMDVKVPRRAQRTERGTVYVEKDVKAKTTQNIRFNQLVTKGDSELTGNERLELQDPKGGGKQSMTQTQKSRTIIETPGK